MMILISTNMSFKKIRGNFPVYIKEYNKFKQVVPNLIANTVKNHFLAGFRKGGGQTDRSRNGWAKRQQESGKRARRSGRALLVNIGDLRSDIKTRRVSFRSIVVGTKNIPYATFINEGTENMVQREFVGRSRELERRKIIKIINIEFLKLFR